MSETLGNFIHNLTQSEGSPDLYGPKSESKNASKDKVKTRLNKPAAVACRGWQQMGGFTAASTRPRSVRGS